MKQYLVAIAFLCAVYLPSATCSARSTNAHQVESSSALPVLVFQTIGHSVQDRTRVPSSLTVLTPNPERTDAFTASNYNGRVELSVRGNSSYYYQKKNYRIELQDETGKDRKAPLLGLPVDSDWVLYASVTDKTFTRNVLGHELWRRTGRYAVRWRFVEVFIITNRLAVPAATPEQIAREVPRVLIALSATNSFVAGQTSSNSPNRLASSITDSYTGVYVLMEKIKRGKERVNLARLRPADTSEPNISGGYILKKDDQGRGQRGLLTGQEFKVRYEEPKEEDLTVIQREWIARYLDDFEKALFGRNFRDPLDGYRKYVDVDSFIDFHWLVEVSKNADGYLFSQYMHKDRGGKLTMGPVWDWDNAFGSTYFQNSLKTSDWRFESATDPDYTWYRRLFEDPDFLQRYVDRWSELRMNTFATSNVMALVDGIAGNLRGVQLRNDHRWPPSGTRGMPVSTTNDVIQEEVRWLKEWITSRLAWIDSQDFPKPVVQILHQTSAASPTLAIARLTGRIFYTTDLSDPRATGGGVAQGAIEYREPCNLATNATVTARARSNFGLWSAPIVAK